MTLGRRSKRTRAWKRVRARARNPKTRAALGVYIRRSIAEAMAPFAGGDVNRRTITQCVQGFLDSLPNQAPGPLVTFEPVPEADFADLEKGIFRVRIDGPPSLLARLAPFMDPSNIDTFAGVQGSAGTPWSDP
jgi:hypothetical protein